jgi:8-oxo-dGTP diphosphatase
VLGRPADARLGLEIALVHRPGRDDWSLPKGKLLAGEHPVLAAMREVAEETGHRSLLGPAVGVSRYLRSGTPKRVRYWSLAAAGGEFAVSKEIDDLVWLPPDAAQQLARPRDQSVIERFRRLRLHLARPLLLVRPGSLVSASGWDGPDHERPLDRRGRQQAKLLAELLSAYGVRRAFTADDRRCAQTLRPFQRGSNIKHEPVIPARQTGRRLRSAATRVFEVAQDGVPTAVCAEQRQLERLCEEMASTMPSGGRPVPDLPRGAMCAMHLDPPDSARIVSSERILTC